MIQAFNTGRQYSKDGQIIAFEQQPSGVVYFVDFARGIDGEMALKPPGSHDGPRFSWLMTLYDLGNGYTWPADSAAFRDFTRRAAEHVKAAPVPLYRF